MHILVVDDELVSRKLMEMIMTGCGHCDTAETGEAAIELFSNALENNNPYDLITLDISMPGMGGLMALIRIREIEKEKSLPEIKRVKIIMVTGDMDKSILIECLKNGCDDYMTKPFKRDIMIKKMIKLGLLPADYINIPKK